MSAWDWFKQFWSDHGDKSGKPVWFHYIDPSKIDDDDLRAAAGVEAVAGTHYYRVAVRRMNLKSIATLGTKHFPVVHSQVVAEYANTQNATYPTVAGDDRIGDLDIAASGGEAGESYPLTPLLPLHAGGFEMVAGVVNMNGDNPVLRRLTSVVGKVTAMVPAATGAAATASTVIGATGKAVECVDELLGHGDGEILLGVHTAMGETLGRPLRSGLYALLNPNQVGGGDSGSTKPEDPDRLMYTDDQLSYQVGDSGLEHLADRDWCVFEIRLATHRHLNEFPDIQALLQKALDALNRRDIKGANVEWGTALTLVYESPQIVDNDREALIDEITAPYIALAKRLKLKVEGGGAHRAREAVAGPAIARKPSDGEVAAAEPAPATAVLPPLQDFVLRVVD